MFLRLLAAMAALLLASCGSVRLPMPDLKPYRMEIQQGNFVSQEMVSQLKLGMSKDQVRFVLGTPLITDSFHAERWDYVFRRQRVNSRELEQRKIAVFFEDGKLKRIEGDVAPAASADAAAVRAPEASPAPSSATTARPEAAAQTAAEAATSAPRAAPVPPAQDKPGEKSWWQRLKDKF
jgi:outer membrane protein assembly factor BamE